MGANEECLIAPDSDCRVTRSVYRTSCIPCDEDITAKPSVYIGTTARTLHSRQMEHKRAIINRNLNNAMSKHHIRSHSNIPPKFETTVVRGGIKYNVERFCYEGLFIEKLKQDHNFQILNQKSEWGNTG